MAGVIRADRGARPERFSFHDVERQAREVLDRAERQAAEILAAARRAADAEAAREHSRGYEAGFQEGREAGRLEALSEARDAALQESREALARLDRGLTEVLGAFEAEKRRLLSAAETGLIELALAIARRVCGRTAALHADVAIETTRRLLDLARHEHDVELLLNPAEYATVQHALPELLHTLGSSAHVRLRADEGIGPGGCVLRGRCGTIDATIDTQLDRIAEVIAPSLPPREPEAKP